MESSDREALVVLGMHRSGTSLCAAMLTIAGADGPKDPLPANEYNETGHWEPRRLCQLHDEMLSAMGVDWQTPFTFPEGFLTSAKVAPYRDRLRALIGEEFGDSRLFCLKDPRISRLLPLWKHIFASEQIAPKYVIVIRNPLEVADSLKHRSPMHWSVATMLWLRHILEAELGTRGCDRMFVTYDDLLADWRTVLREVGRQFRISWPRRMSEIDVDFDKIISRSLRHHVRNLRADGRELSSLVKDTYDASVAAAQSGADAQIPEFDRIFAQLREADRAFEPLFMVERARWAEEIAGLRKIAPEQQDAGFPERLEAANAQLALLGQERDRLLGELSGMQSRIDELTGLAASRERDLDEARTELEGYRLVRDALAAAEERVLAMSSEVALVHAELSSGAD
ncbi:MAG: sulfotransferase [Candidatus Eremiobacteraeota bacterium]|nr:sulfotransferase [Candidatus Eremiobacteraeota bacterium]